MNEGRSVDEQGSWTKSEHRITFGWGDFRPKCLQFLNGPKWFLLVTVVYTMATGIILAGFPVIILPSIEKQFSLTGKELGVIVAAVDITALVFGVFISYYGDYSDKIRWIGGGATVTGFGVFLFAVPHFITGPYQPPTFQADTSDMCSLVNSTANMSSSECSAGNGNSWYYMAIFVISQLTSGVGITTLNSLVPPYLDENVEPKQMPFFLGSWYCAVFVGPGVGVFLAGVFMNIYVDISQPSGIDLTPEDPNWIGAWWLGYLIFSLLIFLCAIFILGYPKKMPGAKERRDKHVREGNLRKANDCKKASLKEILPQLKCLLMNWTFLFNCLGVSAITSFQGSLLPFYAKIIELKFGLDPVTIGYLLSAVMTSVTLVGVYIGSFIVKMFSLKTTCRKSALTVLILGSLTIVCPLGFLIPGCQNANIAEISTSNTQRNDKQSTIKPDPTIPLGTRCNLNCPCPQDQFTPICGSDDVTYSSPCHAGCTTQLADKTFTNCSCIRSTIPGTILNGTAEKGYCDRDCKNLIPFMAIVCFNALSDFMGIIPGQTVVLRCVPDNKRSLAIGMQYLFLKVIGLVPGPIIFGHIVDSSCRLWQKICGEKGRCFDYDIDFLSLIICIFGSLCLATAALCFFLSWYLLEPEKDTNNTFENRRSLDGEEHQETKM